MPGEDAKPPLQRQEPKNDFRKLGLDGRVVNALAAQGIFALEDLAQLTARQLASFPGVGPSSAKRLGDYLGGENPAQAGAIALTLSPASVKTVDDWRRRKSGSIVSRAEAIQRLLEMGLATEKDTASPK
jgi:hypothetical protein